MPSSPGRPNHRRPPAPDRRAACSARSRSIARRPPDVGFAEGTEQKPTAFDFVSIGLLPGPRRPHARIAERYDAMLKAGLEDEVTMLRQKYQLTLSLDLPSMRCVGYRQVGVQDGLAPRAEMRDRGIYATRQLAKRQITWMANTLKPEAFDCLAPDPWNASNAGWRRRSPAKTRSNRPSSPASNRRKSGNRCPLHAWRNTSRHRHS